MNVTCPNCATIYRVDPAKVPTGGVRARCAVCSAVFGVAPSASQPVGEARAATPSAPPVRAEPTSPAPAPVAPPVAAQPEPQPAPPAERPRESAPAPEAAARPEPPRPDTPRATAPPPAMPRPAGLPPRPAGAPSRPAPSAAPAPAPSSGTAAGRPAPAPSPAAPEPRPAPETGRKPVNPFLSQDPSQKARRLARALISDMVVYHPAKRREGLRDGTLKELFDEEIKKSWEEFTDQVGRDIAEGTTHFKDALNEILADGRRMF